jgi:hypothetical protein
VAKVHGYICPRSPGRRTLSATGTMTDFWFGFGHVMQWLLSALVKLDWLPVTFFTIVMAIGAIYWMMLQGRYNRQAREKNTHL